jgi:hypothetical protein
LAACRVAGFVPADAGLSETLRGLLEDPDSRVAEAASKALERIHAAEVVNQLVEAFRTETDVTHRWTLLDGLLVLADPGDSITVPVWVTEVRTIAPVAMRRHLDDQLRESRDRTRRDLDWQDRGRE